MEINVQPLCTAFSRHIGGRNHHASGDPLSSYSRIDTGIEDKGVDTSIPCDIYEADEQIIFISPYMRKTAQ
ncbi:hypothetical protein RvVAR0630_33500 [Agrobacterium vitis]|nr:hypothetical protein RvVAR0630_33500 [Agrobacterium vitis]